MALELTETISETLLNLLATVPASRESKAFDPAARAKILTRQAARKAALYSVGLALPPGAAAFATVLPDLVAVWRVQQQLVADVAAAHGKANQLRSEHMLWCLFGHLGAQSVADLVVRTGNQLVVREVAREAMRKSLRAIGVRVTQRVLGKATSRWVPLLGSAIAGRFTYADTRHVGVTAAELFAADEAEARGATSVAASEPAAASVAAAEPAAASVAAAEPGAAPVAAPVAAPAAEPAAAPAADAASPLASPRPGTVGAAQGPDGRYVYADFALGGTLVAAGASRGPWRFRTWEQFRWVDLGAGQGCIQAVHNRSYVRVGADHQLRADTLALAEATRFVAVRGADSRFAFQTLAGRIVVIAAEGAPVLQASETATSGEASGAARFQLSALAEADSVASPT